MTWKECVSGLYQLYRPYLQQQSETPKSHQDSQFPGWHFTWRPPQTQSIL